MNRFITFLAFALSFLLGSQASAVTFPDHTGFVTDQARLLMPAERDALEHELKDLEERTSWEVAVVTVQTLEGQSIERYAQDLFVSWGIGKKGMNNGVLLLVARQERKLRIHTGYHAEVYIPDIVAKHIITDDIAKKTKKEDWSGGIADGTRHIEKIVQEAKDHPDRKPDEGLPAWVVFLIMFAIIMAVILMLAAASPSGGRRYGGGYYGGGGYGGGSYGGGGGGGGFGFGGGDSGGGGASGDA